MDEKPASASVAPGALSAATSGGNKAAGATAKGRRRGAVAGARKTIDSTGVAAPDDKNLVVPATRGRKRKSAAAKTTRKAPAARKRTKTAERDG